MTISRFMAALKQYWRSSSAVAILALLVVGALYAKTPVSYTATATTFMAAQSVDGTSVDRLNSSAFAERRVQSYLPVATSTDVLNDVITALKLNETPAQFAQRITVESPQNTVLVHLTVRADTAENADLQADSLAQAFAKAVKAMDIDPASGQPVIQMSLMIPGDANSGPASPDKKIFIAIGLILAAAAYCGTALIRSFFDRKIRSPRQIIDSVDVPLLGEVATTGVLRSKPLAVVEDLTSPLTESFRHIRTNLQFADAVSGQGIFVVTSSVAGEGKTTVATNTALAFAQHGTKVCIVDADLRQPRIHNVFGIEGATGLSTVLAGQASLDTALHPWQQTSLSILPSGVLPPNPSELLGSDAMNTVLQQLLERFEVVIIDTPPVLAVTDASVLAAQTGNAVLVTGLGRSTSAELRTAVGRINSVGAHVGGVVVNYVAGHKMHRYGVAAQNAERMSRTINLDEGTSTPTAPAAVKLRTEAPAPAAPAAAPPAASASRRTSVADRPTPTGASRKGSNASARLAPRKAKSAGRNNDGNIWG